MDDFCALPANPNIERDIRVAEQNLAASRQQDPIRNSPDFQLIRLPEIDLVSIETILASGLPELDTAAAERIQVHLTNIGNGSERWVADGMVLQNDFQEAGGNTCVFCAQNLSESPVLVHYRAFFSEEYRTHQQNIRQADSNFDQIHSSGAVLLFERSISLLAERRRFWSEFGTFPEFIVDSAEVTANWNAIRTRFRQLLEQKKGAPLDAISISDNDRSLVDVYNRHRDEIITLNSQLSGANQTIATIKQRTATANSTALAATLTRLKTTKARHLPATNSLCMNLLYFRGQGKKPYLQTKGDMRHDTDR